MAINDRKLSNEFLALIFVQDHILFGISSYKQIDFVTFLIFVHQANLVIIGDTAISLTLLMLVTLLVMILFVVDRIV